MRAISVIAAALLFAGCAQKSGLLEKKALTSLSSQKHFMKAKEIEYRKRLAVNDLRKDENVKESVLSKKVTAAFYDRPVFEAMRDISNMIGIPLDESFKPSMKYRITATFDEPLRNVLYKIYNQTNVRYVYENGYLKVANAEYLEKGFYPSERSCERPISINLKDPDFRQVIDFFSSKYGYGFGFDLKKKKIRFGGNYVKVKDFYYKGCSPREALELFAHDNGFAIEEARPNYFVFKDVITWNADFSNFFDYKFTSSGSLEGGSNSNGVTLRFSDEVIKRYEKRLKEIVKDGTYSVTPRGSVTVEASPRTIEEVKAFFLSEVKRTRPIELDVSIYRISLKDGDESDTQISEFIRKAYDSVVGSGSIFMGNPVGQTTDAVGNAFGVKLTAKDRALFFRALNQYADVRNVRDWKSTTRTGFMASFKAVTQIPYVTASTVVQNGLVTTTTDAKTAQVGMIINVLPTTAGKRDAVDLSSNIVVSEYLGDKNFLVNGNSYTLPVISSNEVNIGSRVKLGESIILTGFRAKTDSIEGNGMPGMSRGGPFSVFMGNRKEKNEYSNFIIVITPREIDI